MDTVIHVKVPEGWYAGLRSLAEDSEGTINQQTRLAIRERLERKGLLAERQDGRQTEHPSSDIASQCSLRSGDTTNQEKQ